jgi:ATP-dependent RNA helicase RhlE
VVTVDKIEQRVMFVEAKQKRNVLSHLLNDPALARVLVFTRTKHGANRVSADLEKAGIDAAAIHGNKSQQARQRALEGFRAGHTRVLVATDIAARGIDVDGVTHVINFELPNEPESYVHRIGRTARAGADGVAISLCDGSERSYLRSIERLTRRSLKVEDARGIKLMEPPAAVTPRPAPPRPPVPAAPPRTPAKAAPKSQRNGAPRPPKRRRSGGNAPMHRGSQQHRVA